MKIRLASTVPSGYRELDEAVFVTDLAVQFRYHAWILWVPASALVLCRGKFYAAQWAVDSGRKHKSAYMFKDDEDAYWHVVIMRGDLSRLYAAEYVAEER